MPEEGRSAGEEQLAYSVSEAAEVMGIARGEVLSLVCEGTLAHLRLEHRIFIPKTTLTAWLERNARVPSCPDGAS